MKSAFFFIRIGLGALILTGTTFHPGWTQQSPTRDGEKIDFAQQLLNGSQHKLAALEFAEFIEQYPQSSFLSRAYLGAGESYFFLKEYNKAVVFYQQYAYKFPNGEEQWFGRLRLGQCFFLMGKNHMALTKLTSVDISQVQAPFVQTLYFYLGQVFEVEKNFPQAFANFEKATQVQESGGYTSQAYLQWGNILALQGDYPQAMDKYTKAFKAAQSNDIKGEITIKQAQTLIKQNKNDEAVGAIDKFIAAQKGLDRDTLFTVMLLKARAQEGLKNYDAAWNTYLAQASEFPDRPAVYCGMAHISYAKDQFQEAASLFMDCFNKSKKDPLRADILFNAFLMYQNAGMNDKAAKVWGLYRRQYPQGRWIFDLDLALANIYIQEQKYEKAEELLRSLLKKTDDPHWPQALFEMGYDLQLAGKNNEALLAYEKIVKQYADPELKYLALKNSAIIYLNQNDPDKAARALGAITQDPTLQNLPIKGYLWLAQYWQSKNDPQKMLDVLTLAQKGPFPAPQIQGIDFFMGEAYRLQKHFTQAEKYYDRIIANREKNSYQGRAYLGRGLCLAARGEAANAQKALEGAISSNPEDNFVTLRARFELARLFESQQNIKTAVKLYMMVGLLYKDPEYGPRALLRAGDLLQKLNEPREALRAYQQILEDYPQSQGAQKAKELIRKIS